MAKEAKIGDHDPVFSLPPYKVEQVFMTHSESMDWGLSLMGIPNLWVLGKGEGAKVGVLDTGCAMNHPDLKDAIVAAKDFTRSRSGPEDVQGHGTHVAGTIGARENSSGVVGVAPKCSLYIGKVLGDDGSGSPAGIAAGIDWAIARGVDIISMSLGAPMPVSQIHAAVKRAVKAGIFVIAAAGNEGPSPNTIGYPAKYSECICVGSIDRRKQVSRFSSRGQQVDIVAPGDQILSCYPPRGVAKLSGTSMATPFVSGVVALKVARQRKFPGGDPIDDQKELMKVLRESATDMHIPGKDNHYGYGIIDPKKLLAYGKAEAPGNDGSSHSALMLEASDLTKSGQEKVTKFVKDVGESDEINIRIKTKF
jgi:subtilisin family serine protease